MTSTYNVWLAMVITQMQKNQVKCQLVQRLEWKETDGHWSYALMALYNTHTYTHTHIRLTALCPGLPGWAGTRKVKPIWILRKQVTVSGSGTRCAICKSAPRTRQTTRQHTTAQFFTGRMPFLPPNQQCQSTEGNSMALYKSVYYLPH